MPRGQQTKPLFEWKAGFIHDAEDLHLATKESIASVIRAWFQDADVRKAYAEEVPGGEDRLERLEAKVRVAWEANEKRFAGANSIVDEAE